MAEAQHSLSAFKTPSNGILCNEMNDLERPIKPKTAFTAPPLIEGCSVVRLTPGYLDVSVKKD
jgi:hypothetical protein